MAPKRPVTNTNSKPPLLEAPKRPPVVPANDNDRIAFVSWDLPLVPDLQK